MNTEELPKVLGKNFYDNYEVVQSARAALDDKLFKAKEKLKYKPDNQELLAKVEALYKEKSE